MTGEKRTIPEAAEVLTKKLGFKVTADDIRYVRKAGYWEPSELFAGRYVLYDQDLEALSTVLREHNRDAKKPRRSPPQIRRPGAGKQGGSTEPPSAS